MQRAVDFLGQVPGNAVHRGDIFRTGRGNAADAAGIEMLEWFTPACQRVDVAALMAKARVCLERVRELGRERLQEFDRALIPHVTLLP